MKGIAPSKKIIYCTKNERNRRTCSYFSAEGHSTITWYVDQILPNFDLPPPLERTIVDILHTMYLVSFIHLTMPGLFSFY